jgi:hypothetical protein
LHAVHAVPEVHVAQLLIVVEQFIQFVPLTYDPDTQLRQLVPGETQVAQVPTQGFATLLVPSS